MDSSIVTLSVTGMTDIIEEDKNSVSYCIKFENNDGDNNGKNLTDAPIFL